ncbi:NADH-quinone oxidoreductase subunit NuoF [Candidatus Leptofilum sp.]|uniref:NADH-quinone oxidoreductase subunit NuoF n=1 Tax=Candidatus Leptofilum sp. TaxID=3241576 RepID=UPI003B5B292C
MTHILLRNRDIENIHKLDVYRANGGYEALQKVLNEYEPGEVIDIVKASGLRGRGGAGFPTGLKWSFIPKASGDKYIAVNSDESEMGTFKDRALLEHNPHQVIEGAMIAAYAVGAQTIYNYMRGEFMGIGHHMEEAVRDCYEAGILGDNIFGSDFSCQMHNYFGAGAYICGEETALLNSLMGELGQPWTRPPFPAVEGLYQKPTVVNNTETMANVPPILLNGADWYRSIGTEQSPGPKIMCLSGHVKNPGTYEVEMGMPYRELIYGEQYGGGILGDKQFKALLPIGGSGPVVVADALDAPITYEGLKPFGSDMGSGSVVVMDETVDMVWVAMKLSHFFKHESCGKCTPCREGTFWMDKLITRLYKGEGSQEDLDVLRSVASKIGGRTLCALGDFATSPVLGTYKHFANEYEAKVKAGQRDTAVPTPTTD